MANNAVQSGAGRNNATKAIVIVGSLILVALIGVIVTLVMLLNRPEPEPMVISEEPRQRTVVINEDTVEEQVEEIINTPFVEPGYYEVSMTMDWVFPDGTSPSTNAYVRNVPGNTNDVYFDIQLRDTGETIYESPVLPLGSYLDSITLDRDLDAGTYQCVIIYHLIDENQRTLSTLNMGLDITVES